jgi:hypothetical protein
MKANNAKESDTSYMALSQYIAARTIEADLIELDGHFSEVGISDMRGIIYLKAALISLSNVVDFEREVRPHYGLHRELSPLFAEAKKELVFAKYLRNKFVGHIHPQLVDKAVEWRPELNYMASDMGQKGFMRIVNIFLLETAINTYVDHSGKHKLFASETDLIYPPDWSRFLSVLETGVRSSMRYLAGVCQALDRMINHPDPSEIDLQLWKKAGGTVFDYLRK